MGPMWIILDDDFKSSFSESLTALIRHLLPCKVTDSEILEGESVAIGLCTTPRHYGRVKVGHLTQFKGPGNTSGRRSAES